MTSPASADRPAPTPFHDLDAFIALPRISGLSLSPDGSRLVTSLSTLDRKRTRYVSAVWEIDPAGERQARRLTRSGKGEAGPMFAADGSIYFTSARPDPDGDSDDEPKAALWQIPAEGGEARVVHSRVGGVGGVCVARDADTVVVTAGVLAGAFARQAHDGAAGADRADLTKTDEELRKLRKDTKVSAILHTGYPVRYWDHDLGADEDHLFAVEAGPATSSTDPSATDSAEPGSVGPDSAGPNSSGVGDADIDAVAGDEPAWADTVDSRPPTVLRHLTSGMGQRLRESSAHLSPDGRVAIITAGQPLAAGDRTAGIVAVDVAAGTTRELLPGTTDHEYFAGPISPDSTRALIVVDRRSTPERAGDQKLGLLDLRSGEITNLAHDWDRWGRPLGWWPDGSAVLVQADDDGRGPLFRIDIESGAVHQLTHDDATYSDGVVSPDGQTVYGVRSSYDYPAEVVRVDVASGEVTRLPNPAQRPLLPGWLEEIETTADDGSRVRAWLALPEDTSADSPAPLALWVHGGPLSSWNAWSWRWTPWNLVAQGYAVLLPDPALSTGYGWEFIQRGWGQWGKAPYTDLMAITDEAVARQDIDESKTVAMGGSFGGYMANWIAGHTDRFSAIVTHASLWALDQFGPTTDAAWYWNVEMTPQMAMENSPHLSVDKIVTPMLVIHGDRDYRVPIGEGLRLWWELLALSGSRAGDDGTSQHRFLYYPDENHWILTPQNAKVWYQVVLGFIDQHVHGTKPELPRTLGL